MPAFAAPRMKLSNSLTGPSNRDDVPRSDRCWHRWIPALLVTAYTGCYFAWPVIQDVRSIVFIPLGLLIGYSYWFMVLGIPKDFHLILAFLFTVIFFSLPWFSVLASSRRATTICTLGVVLLLLTQISGCRLLKDTGRLGAEVPSQKQSSCAIPPWVRRSLVPDSPHTPISLLRLSTNSTHS